MKHHVFKFERSVRFEDVDAAGIVFFGKFLSIVHEAMEAFFSPVEGGYVGIIRDRRLGFPAVHLDIDYTAPLRYGDKVTLHVDVTKIGRSSVTFRHKFVRGDGVDVALAHHICAVSSLETIRAVSIPDDLREHLERHLATD